jgi:hypothetical protein
MPLAERCRIGAWTLIKSLKAMTKNRDFKGNKQSLPSKLCKTCGRTMTWRKAWAKNWEQVLYCSDACRKNKGASSV